MLKYKKTQIILHKSSGYLGVDIFNLPKRNPYNDRQILDWLIHSKYYQWNYKNYPDGFNGNIMHGPYLVSEIQVSDYTEVGLSQMLTGINITFENEILYTENDVNRQKANWQFQSEVYELLNCTVRDCVRYYHLNLELSTEDESVNVYDKMSDIPIFSFFNSYIAISETQLFLFQIGDD